MDIQMKRVYDPPQPSDGKRVLIDRLWPRGLTKEKAKVSLWLKNIAPSTTLRKWFDHDPAKWNEFKIRYHEELKKNNEVVSTMVKLLKNSRITIVYGAKDEKHNDAVILKNYLETQYFQLTKSM